MEDTNLPIRSCPTCGKVLTEEQIKKRPNAKYCCYDCFGKRQIDPTRLGYDPTFLDEDNEFSFYFIGYWVSDGNLSKDEAIVGIYSSDREIIDQFVERTKYINSIGGRSIREGKNKPEYCVKYMNKVSDQIQALGYEPGSKFRKEFVPQRIKARPDLYNHFLRGAWDGDGTIHVHTDGSLRASLVDSNEEYLMDIHRYLLSIDVVKGGYVGPKGTIFVLSFCGHEDAKSLCNYMYKDATIMLHRKHDQYLIGRTHELKFHSQLGLTCAVDGCGAPAHCKELCKKHSDAYYGKLYRLNNQEHIREKDKLYKEENRDKINEQRRARHAENPDKENARSREWKRAHTEQVHEQKVTYNDTHRDEINQYKREYRQENTELVREQDRAAYHRNHDASLDKTHRYKSSHRQELNAKQKEYYQEHKDEQDAYHAEYREKNREKRRLAAKAYYEKNKEKILQKEKAKRDAEQAATEKPPTP